MLSRHDWLLKWGMSEAGATLLTRLGGVLLVLFVALTAYRVTKSVVVRGIARLAQRTTSSWDDVVMRHRVLQRVAHLVPTLVIYHFAALVHNSDRGRELAWPRLPSSDHLAIRHPERRHGVENLAPDPCLNSLCRQPSRSHR